MPDGGSHDTALNDLLDRLRQGKALVLLAGAGISVSAGIRTGEQLTRELREKHAALFQPGEALGYSEVFRRAVPDVRLRRARIEAECIGRRSQTEHLWIAQLMKERRVRGIITTNFDHLIEQALMRVGASGISVVLYDDELRCDLSEHRTPILVKIHGDFLFDDIANLPEELARKLRQNMTNALCDFTDAADILVVGYSGSDDTVVQLIGEIVRNRPATATRVWWSEYRDDEPSPRSPFAQLLSSAARAGNPVTRIGPWGAAECLTSLGAGLGAGVPIPRPFGIGLDGLTMPVHFGAPLQALPGDAAQRSRSLDTASRLRDWVNRGGVILVAQEAGAGGSTLLAAVAEAAGPRGLYFDTRFAERPIFIDLHRHLAALAGHLSPEESPPQIFLHGAVVVIDGLEMRSLPSNALIDEAFLSFVQALADAQRLAGSGALIFGTHANPARLREEMPWLPGEEATYRVHQRVISERVLEPPQDLEPLLDVVGLPSTAIPSDCAVRAALGSDAKVDWRRAWPFLDRRGQYVILHEFEMRRRRSRLGSLQATANDLARELMSAADTMPPLRRMGLVLEAESLYLGLANRPHKALNIFMGCADAAMQHPLTRPYIFAKLLDYVSAVVSDQARWSGLCFYEAASFIELVSLFGNHDAASMQKLLELISKGRTDLEKRLLLAAVNTESRYRLRVLIPGYRKARRARRQPRARAIAALQVGAVWLGLGTMTGSKRFYQRGILWSRRAQRDASRSKDDATGA